MPSYQFQANSFNINRKALLVDTNVFVKAFNPSEEQHEYARFFLEETEYQLLIPVAVVIETWGMLVGARQNWQGGYEFLAWLNTPDKAIILPQQGEFLKEHTLVTGLRNLDCIDAIIGNLAHNISTQCNLKPSLAVATYDTNDFYKLKSYDINLRISIYDMKEFLLQDLD